MSEMAVTVFEILERAWAQQDCSLVDMKVAHSVNYVMWTSYHFRYKPYFLELILETNFLSQVEFGLSQASGEVLLADVIDNDSWRLWPAGDKKQQKDKQAYRELTSVDDEGKQITSFSYTKLGLNKQINYLQLSGATIIAQICQLRSNLFIFKLQRFAIIWSWEGNFKTILLPRSKDGEA